MNTSRIFMFCDICEKLVGLIQDGPGELVCCGQPMVELVAGQVEASAEKHIPQCSRAGDKLLVEVGSVLHPATEEHHINWIALCQGNSMQRKELNPTLPAKAEFCLEEGEGTVYAYCNLHGLWEAKI